MKHALWKPLVVALAAVLMATACAADRTTESTGEYVDDATITTKVKAALFDDAGLKAYVIGVETYKDVVQLSGFVDSSTVKSRAGQVAAAVSGVRSVRNTDLARISQTTGLDGADRRFLRRAATRRPVGGGAAGFSGERDRVGWRDGMAAMWTVRCLVRQAAASAR